MGNTKLIQFQGVVRPGVFPDDVTDDPRSREVVLQDLEITWHLRAGPARLKTHLRAEDLAFDCRKACAEERVEGGSDVWVIGCYETWSMHDSIDGLVRYVLWRGLVVRVDLDWSDVKVLVVEGGEISGADDYDLRGDDRRPR